MTKNEVYKIMKISKNRFIQSFGIIVVLLGIIRCTFPNIVKTHLGASKSNSSYNKSIESADKSIEKTEEFSQKIPVASKFFNKDGSLVKNKIYFGEMTFFDGSGFDRIEPIEWDYKLGSWINLPQKTQ